MRKQWIVVPLLAVGFYVPISLLIPTVLGWYLGNRIGHELLLSFVGLGIGTVVMAYGVYRMVRVFMRQASSDEDCPEGHTPSLKTLLQLLAWKNHGGKPG